MLDYEEDEDTQGACPTMQEQLISMWEDDFFDELTIYVIPDGEKK